MVAEKKGAQDQKKTPRTKLMVSERVLIGIMLFIALFFIGADLYDEISTHGRTFFYENWEQLISTGMPFVVATWLWAKMMVTGKDVNEGWAHDYLIRGSKSVTDLDAESEKVGNKVVGWGVMSVVVIFFSTMIWLIFF